MKSTTIFKSTPLLIIALLIFSCSPDETRQTNLIEKNDVSYIDGPHVFHKNGKLRIININQHDEILETIVDRTDSLLIQVPNQIPDHFYVKLNPDIKVQPTEYETPDKIIAISDIEGNYYSFVNLLIGNNITDKKLNWSYGAGHLVLNGDFVDRGEYVTQVLWLIYKLEQEAEAIGGKVHFINGNHEIMNMKGDFRYVVDKYQRLAKNLKIAPKDFYNNENEIGKWLRTKNIVEKIGDVLFTHGGISATLLKEQLDLNEINSIARKNYGSDLEHVDEDSPESIIFGRYGPLWYRGLVTKYKYYPKASMKEVNNIHKFYKTEKIVLGHCIVDDISTDYEGKVVRIDLHHPTDSSSTNESKALLIENGVLYKVNHAGNKAKL